MQLWSRLSNRVSPTQVRGEELPGHDKNNPCLARKKVKHQALAGGKNQIRCRGYKSVVAAGVMRYSSE